MKSHLLTILFFLFLIAACATSTETEDVETTAAEDIEQEATVDDMLKRDQERLDSMEQALSEMLDN